METRLFEVLSFRMQATKSAKIGKADYSSMPVFRKTPYTTKLLERKRDTAQFIRSIWEGGSSYRRDPLFLSFLVRCGWNNDRHGARRAATLEWRNRHFADFLHLAGAGTSDLAEGLGERLPSVKKKAWKLLKMQTGITRCYGAVRKATLDFVESEPKKVALAFEKAASSLPPEQKILQVLKLIDPKIKTLLNGITPTLACLDPARRFPIMNGKTKPLLKKLNQQADYDGAIELYRLIGRHNLNIKDSFELDVYAASAFPLRRRKP